MDKNKNLVKCLFGHHNYTIPDKDNPDILLCKYCKRFGYSKYPSGLEIWYKYNEKGNMIHCKTSSGYEAWFEYDERGNLIHRKDSGGYEYWYDEKGNVIHWKDSSGNEEWYDGKRWKSKKPKNWKYEKHIK